MKDTPIYDSVVADQDWSPDQLSPPFDVDTFIALSYRKVEGRTFPEVRDIKTPVKIPRQRRPRK